MERLGSIFRVLAAIVLVLLGVVFVRVAVWNGPMIVYRLRRHSTMANCASIRPGISQAELQNAIKSSAPRFQTLSGNRFVFGDWEACEVEIDPETGRVLNTKMLQSYFGQNVDER
jgi:hypothetical protein